MNAARQWQTGVIGARIAVVTFDRDAIAATTGGAVLTNRTQITIIADAGVGRVDAPGFGFTLVVGADVVVVAFERQAAEATPVCTLVTDGAGVAVITGSGVGLVLAAKLRIAGVVGAHIPVVANQGCSRLALSIRASVAVGTHIVVRTGKGVVGMDTARSRVARIIGTGVAIITV
jgi:hypothetical protein